MKLRIASLSLLALLCGTIAIPLVATDYGTLYSNGPVNGTIKGWDISGSYGTMVSNSFYLSGTGGPVNGFSFSVWEYPGDSLEAVQWSITTANSGQGTVLGSGIASGGTLTDTFLFNNGTYNIDKITLSGLNVNITSAGTYWLNLFDASVPSGDPVGWDENDGVGCYPTSNCPSVAWVGFGSTATFIGTKSEDPDILTIINGTTPEPSSFLLFGSGILGLAGVLRRKLF